MSIPNISASPGTPSCYDHLYMALLSTLGFGFAIVTSLVHRTYEVSYPIFQALGRFLPLESSEETWNGKFQQLGGDLTEAISLSIGFIPTVLSELAMFEYHAVSGIFYPSEEAILKVDNAFESIFSKPSTYHVKILETQAKPPRDIVKTPSPPTSLSLGTDQPITKKREQPKVTTTQNNGIQTPRRAEPKTPGGLPNFVKGLSNVCWMNTAIQHVYHAGPLFRDQLDKQLVKDQLELERLEKLLVNVRSFALNPEISLDDYLNFLQKNNLSLDNEAKGLVWESMKCQMEFMLNSLKLSADNKNNIEDLELIQKHYASVELRLTNYSKDYKTNGLTKELLGKFTIFQAKWMGVYPEAKLTSLTKIVSMTIEKQINALLARKRILKNLSNIFAMLDAKTPASDSLLQKELNEFLDSYMIINQDLDKEDRARPSRATQRDSNSFCALLWGLVGDLAKEERFYLEKSYVPTQTDGSNFRKSPTLVLCDGYFTVRMANEYSNHPFVFDQKKEEEAKLKLIVGKIIPEQLQKFLKATDPLPDTYITTIKNALIKAYLSEEKILDRSGIEEEHYSRLQELIIGNLHNEVSEAVEKESNNQRSVWQKYINQTPYSLDFMIKDKEVVEVSEYDGSPLVSCIVTCRIPKYPKDLLIQLDRTIKGSYNAALMRMEGTGKNQAPISDIDSNGVLILGEDGDLHRYELISAIHHNGGLNGGHYTLIKKDPSGAFFSYNDELVTELPPAEALELIRTSSTFHFKLISPQETASRESKNKSDQSQLLL